MKKNKTLAKIITIAMCAAMTATALTACGSTQTASSPESSVQSESTSSATENKAESQTQAAQTRTVTDICGRQVEVPAEVKSVVCTGIPATRMMVYAGGVNLIRGVSANEQNADQLTTCPAAEIYAKQFAEIESVGSGWPNNEIYGETIIGLEPDVVISAGADPKQLDELQEQLGKPVIGIMATSFNTEDFFQSMDLLGEVLGTTDHVKKVNAAVRGYIEDLENRTKDIPEEGKPTAYYGAVSFKGYNAIDGTYGNYPPFDAIHAVNVADEAGTGAMLIDKEKLADWDPDVLFVNAEFASLKMVNDDYAANPGFYDNLSAVKNGRVYSQAAYNAVYTNIEIAICNAYYAGTVLYPEQFKDVNMEEKAIEIISTMVGTDATEYVKALQAKGLGFGPITIGK